MPTRNYRLNNAQWKGIWASYGNAEPLQVQVRLYPIREYAQEETFWALNCSFADGASWALMEVSAEPGSSGIFLSFSLDFKGGGLCCFCLFIGFHCHRCTPILWTVISSYIFAPPLFLLFTLLPTFLVCSMHIFVFWYKYILWFCVRVFLTYINSMCSRSLSVSSSFHLVPFKKYFPWK